jgi:hypothetical protein
MENGKLCGFNDSELLIINSDDEDIDAKGLGLIIVSAAYQIRSCCQIRSRCC